MNLMSCYTRGVGKKPWLYFSAKCSGLYLFKDKIQHKINHAITFRSLLQVQTMQQQLMQ